MLFSRNVFFILGFIISFGSGSAQQPELILPSSNSNKLEAMAVSRDERFMASGDLDGKVKIWETATGKQLKTLKRKDIFDKAFTPDNKSLVITSFTPTEVYNIFTGQSVYLGNYQFNHGLDISRDGKWIITVSDGSFNNGLACIWDTKNFQLRDSFRVGFNDEVKFSHSGRQAIFYGWGSVMQLWALDKPELLYKLAGHNSRITSVSFDDKDEQLISVSGDSTAILWDIRTGLKKLQFRGHTNTVWDARFHPGGKKLITVSGDNTARIWSRYTGALEKTIQSDSWIYKIKITADGKKYILTDAGGHCTIWDAKTDTVLHRFKTGDETCYYAEFIKEGKELFTGNYDPVISRWDLLTGKKVMTYGIQNERITSLSLSHNERYLLTTTRSGQARKIDVTTGKVVFWVPFTVMKDYWATSAAFSPNDSLIVISGGYEESKLFNQDGDFENFVDDESDSYESVSVFNSEGSYLLHINSFNAQLIRVADNKRVLTVDSLGMFTPQRFSPDGKYLITGGNNRIRIWSVETQEKIRDLSVDSKFPSNLAISPGSTYFLCVDPHKDKLMVWEMATGKKVKETNGISDAFFSADNKHIKQVYTNGKVTSSEIAGSGEKLISTLNDSTDVNRGNYLTPQEDIMISINRDQVLVRNFVSGNTLGVVPGNEVAFGKSGQFLYVAGDDVIEVYQLRPFRLAYRHFITHNDEYLVTDEKGRFDGTDSSRRILYFACGAEVIDLNQAKDQLWVPGLAERIMKGDSINAKTLSDLNICGLTPETEDKSTAGQFRFHIKPRRGGLGETVVYVNGIEARRYKPGQLKKQGDVYELILSKTELSTYFIAGKENPVTVKAYTADNAVSSRGIIINEDKTQVKTTTPPNLYAVMVGVSDYKDEELDLKYAAKDANDISAAVAASARKLLNTDGNEHVFVYDLTTSEKRYQLPEKNSIRKVLEEIGKMANANDILLLFFAGHGVMEGEKKQFYFLTADASKTTAASAVADVGISTSELTEWMKPQYIKAQKRILIFDACNSGQAILDLVKVGNEDQGYMAARSDEQSQQIKAIDKLNEQSGFFILY